MIPQHLKDWKPVCKKSKCGSQITLCYSMTIKPKSFNLGQKSIQVENPLTLAHLLHLDNSLKLDKQINTIISTSFYHIRRLAKDKPFLNRKSFETAIHAFISTRLDYCNSLYVGLPLSSISRLQIVQNAAAHLFTGSRKRDHITPILCTLHWLPVRYRIDYKIFVYKALNNLAPRYLSDLLTTYNPARSLRSQDGHLLRIPRSRLQR